MWNVEILAVDKTKEYSHAVITWKAREFVMRIGQGYTFYMEITGTRVACLAENGRWALTGDFDIEKQEILLEESGVEPEFRTNIRLTRMSKDEKNAQQLLAEREAEARKIYAALRAYFRDHGEKPASLAFLIPKYLKEDDIKKTGRSVEYNPENNGDAPDENLPPFPKYDADDPMPYPDILLEHEAALKEAWGGRFLLSGPEFKMTYANPSQTFLGSQGGIELEEAESAEDSDASPGALMASCQNHLKQLGLVIKMFQNECRGEYTPPGWHTVYPEYLTDRSILTCPALEDSKTGYDLIFPAANPAYFVELYKEVNGIESAEDGANGFVNGVSVESKIPIVIETKPHSVEGTSGSNVLFCDGHVEFVRASDWQESVAPYLAYR